MDGKTETVQINWMTTLKPDYQVFGCIFIMYVLIHPYQANMEDIVNVDNIEVICRQC